MKENTTVVLPLRNLILFPGQKMSLSLGRKKSITAVSEAYEQDGSILLVPQKNIYEFNPKANQLYDIGTLATIVRMSSDEGHFEVIVEGTQRVKVDKFTQISPYFRATWHSYPSEIDDEVAAQFFFEKIQDILSKDAVRAQSCWHSKDRAFVENLNYSDIVERVGECLDFRAAKNVFFEEKREKQMELLAYEIIRQQRNYALEEQLNAKVKESFEKGQKEAYLREKMHFIQVELGEGNVDAEYFSRIDDLKASDEVKAKLRSEIEKSARMSQSSTEYTLMRNYVDFVLDLPFGVYTDDNCNLIDAKRVLDKDHFGLDKIKDRILEFIAVHQLTDDKKDPILCFVGPPGVGKTSIVHSIADALGRKYVRMSLGGVHDEAEIRGHRKTYVGAMPGRIITAIKQGGSMNPVFLLDEIDKITKDYRGDPSAALLEVLDPELNYSFRDNFLELPFDLKDVIFITTANSMDTIPSALADRMEIIEMSGYTPLEKVEIARRHLIPKQMKNNGIKDGQVTISDDVLYQIISDYTRESGVRQLEKCIAQIMRRVARKVVEQGFADTFVSVTHDNLSEFLGIKKQSSLDRNAQDEVGIATGLAWTQYGGDILNVEVSLMRGKGDITLTGSLGDVLKESARTAISFLRAHAKTLGIADDTFTLNDIHIHLPEGAIPKDGPSAGITLATAVYSAVSGKKVRSDVAMTGEITLRGNVLAIGGLKEKLLAAHRAGIREVLIPKDNLKDMEEIPVCIRDEIDVCPVGNVLEVFEHAII